MIYQKMDIFKKEENKPDIQEKSAKKINHKTIFFLSILILFIISAGVVYFYAQRPARGVIRPSDNKAEAENQGGSALFDGKHLSFVYGDSYTLKSHDTKDENGAAVLEQAYLTETSSFSKKIGLSVRNLPAYSLKDCPDFTMRSMNPQKYVKNDFSFGGINGISFVGVDQNPFEKTFFIPRENFLAILSFSSPAASDIEYENEIAGIIKSIQWKK